MTSKETKDIKELLEKLLDFKNLRDVELDTLIHLVSYEEHPGMSTFLKALFEEKDRRLSRK
ncbi:hypothetical protein NH288_04965 [Anaerococcus sp. NML200537]|uniref:hypothetical protein n=1 Tax=Anaerococcus sp. NML200537 TaxID=2954485 RepID=UPI0022370781|nr:hypothetical protein [Anaerococcus sp. NML200537]MCW6701434.1 hypothetical protein [Anaerococcus sp. NML200537]